MRTLFVPVAGHGGLEALIATACLGAQRFDSLMEGARILELAEYVDFAGDLPGSGTEQTSWADLRRVVIWGFQRVANFDSEPVGVFGADRCDAMGCVTIDGSGSETFCRAVRGRLV